MAILAIDTANEYLSLALKTKQGTSTAHLKVGNRQSEHLLPELDRLLEQNNLTINDLQLIIYNQGPGAFTGLRIGLAIALGLAYSINCKLLAIPAFMPYINSTTLQVAKLIVALDARLGQIYLAGINQDDYSYCIEPQLINPQDLAIIIKNNPNITPENTIITGAAIQVYQEKIDPSLLNSYTYLDQDFPAAERMLTFSENNSFPYSSALSAELLYVRNKVALNMEEQRLSKASC